MSYLVRFDSGLFFSCKSFGLITVVSLFGELTSKKWSHRMVRQIDVRKDF